MVGHRLTKAWYKLTGQIRQFDDYSCGAVAVLQALKLLGIRASASDVIDLVNPSPVHGAGVGKVTRALRAYEVRVSKKANLTSRQLYDILEEDGVAVVCRKIYGIADTHWVVLVAQSGNFRVYDGRFKQSGYYSVREWSRVWAKEKSFAALIVTTEEV